MKAKQESLPIIFPANIRHFVGHRSGGRSHWHEEIELQYIVDGHALPLCNLKDLHLTKGDILFVNSNELHYGNNSPKFNEFYCFHINKAFFSNHIGDEHIIFQNVIRDEECAKLLDEVIHYHKLGGYKNRVAQAGHLYRFFEIVTERYVKEVLDESTFKKRFKRDDKFNDIVQFIEDNLTEELTLSDVAEHFFVTSSYLSHFFKKRSGKSVIQYLNEARMIRAKLYLEQTDMSVSEIAGAVGFDDINYFSRKFRQICQETPTQYRLRHNR